MNPLLLRHPVSLAGAAIATASAVGFLALAVADLLGLFANPYAGLVIFVLLPAGLILGLLLIPLGNWLQRRAVRRDPTKGEEWPVIDLRLWPVRKSVLIIAALTAVNGVIVLLAGYGTLHYMESPSFCGQTCHTPMHPQFTAWQNGAHGNVACVSCHVGGGARALVHSKLAGVRQLIHVATNSYPRPIPASAADLRPAMETCGTCHEPILSHGVRTRVLHEFADDEANTETVTTLKLHVGGPRQPTPSGRAIHWHADRSIRVEYVATDADRQTIPVVRVTGANGQTKEYVAEGTTPQTIAGGTTRVMDCIDCHNAAAHRISPTAAQAVDRAIGAGRIDRSLPFVRRESVKLLTASYTDEAAAASGIESGLRTLYGGKAGVDPQVVARAVADVQRLYRLNVFPAMKVTWGVYHDNRGHTTSTGCFRCHDDSHVAKDGSKISGDCSYCHDME